MPLLIALLLALPSTAAPLKAPDFALGTVFNAPVAKLASLSELKGKVVYLEFWATWCGPCVAGFPRTNRLIGRLAGEPVVFLAVSDESPSDVEAWLKRKRLDAWAGADPAGAVFKAYGVRGRPDGFLIGKDGTLLARLHPEDLTEKDVRDAIAGKFKPRPVIRDPLPDSKPMGVAEKRPLFEAVLLPHSTASPGMIWSDHSLEVRGMPSTTTIAWLWGAERDEVVADEAPKPFDFRIHAPGMMEEARALLKQAVLSSLSVTVGRERRVVDAFALVLSTAPGAGRPQRGDPAEKSGVMFAGEGRLLGKATMADFAGSLRHAARRPVTDETGLEGEYELDLEWDPKEDGARERALESAGLRLSPARREAEFLRIAPAKKP